MKAQKYYAILEPNSCYHIYNHAVGTENLFKQPRNYAYFWQKWNTFISPYFANYAYALMPNHFHVLVKAKPISDVLKRKIKEENTKKATAFINGEISANDFYVDQFARFFKSYSNAINRQEEKRYGSLFKKKFKRTFINTKAAFEYYLCYIHHNPIHHFMAIDYLDYMYTSYSAYAQNQAIEGLSKASVLKSLQTAHSPTGIEAFIKLHEDFKQNNRDNSIGGIG